MPEDEVLLKCANCVMVETKTVGLCTPLQWEFTGFLTKGNDHGNYKIDFSVKMQTKLQEVVFSSRLWNGQKHILKKMSPGVTMPPAWRQCLVSMAMSEQEHLGGGNTSVPWGQMCACVACTLVHFFLCGWKWPVGTTMVKDQCKKREVGSILVLFRSSCTQHLPFWWIVWMDVMFCWPGKQLAPFPRVWCLCWKNRHQLVKCASDWRAMRPWGISFFSSFRTLCSYQNNLIFIRGRTQKVSQEC